MKAEEIRHINKRTKEMAREIETFLATARRMDYELGKIGICRAEWEAYLNRADEPALWEQKV